MPYDHTGCLAKKPITMTNGVLLIDKPVGFSSFQIVQVLKRRFEKVGHAGTLDPFASGLLIILIGAATKMCSSLQVFDKEYAGEMMLGFSTNTYDLSGEVVKTSPGTKCAGSFEELNQVARGFVGEIEQVPPKFSAIKQGGKKLYELSRQGIPVEPKARTITIKSFTINDIRYPLITFKAVVGKGVYIRSLAHDFGKALGCEATLISLRRTRIGEYHVNSARKLGEVLFSHSRLE